MKTKKPLIMLGVGLLMILIGVGAIIWGVHISSDYFEKKKTYIEITAEVIGFTDDGNVNDLLVQNHFPNDEEYATVVKYVVDGKTYKLADNSYSSTPKHLIGQKVKIKYNPKDPSDAIFKYNFSFVILYIVGGASTISGVVLLYGVIFKKYKDK